MKSLIKQLKKKKHLVFLDLEGTQFSHEMIALGAIRVDLDFKYRIRKIHPGIKFYVKSKNPIGKYVQQLTKISPKLLETEGISFKEAMEKFKKYCGASYSKMAFITFGNHDLRILSQSMRHFEEADQNIVDHVTNNSVDFSAFLAQYVRDDNGNPLSLINYLKIFNETPIGTIHDPLCDAQNLLKLYQATIKDKTDIIFNQYLKQLRLMKIFPDPVKKTIEQLTSGKSVTPEEFKTFVKDYIA